ncbi:MAG: mandelate racemase/muconate lactonizing enzyme family protein [Bryobacteraceae bacterium]|nr:mandelate racemase/muconate lactonizing enzyme family protein [Bryobacteraceae bacterium]
MHSGIRITEVRVHRLAGNNEQRFGWSLGWTNRRVATLVEVRTDSGLTGWGDGMFGGDLLVRHPELVIGRSPFEAEAIYDSLRAAPEMQRRRGGQLCGGLDTALWDLMGQALGLPVSRIFGQQQRDRVEPYCTALYRKDWPDLAEGLAEEAVEWKRQGFRTVKMKVGYGPEIDYRNVRAVREAIGEECGLAIDANCAYDTATAVALGRRLEPFDLKWWEEPVLAHNYEGYRRLRDVLSIPLAGGETLDSDSLLHLYVQPRLVDIVQPEVEIIGLTGARRLGVAAWLNDIRIVPHNWGTAVRTVAILHWMSTAPPITEALAAPAAQFEFDRTDHPFRDAVIEETIRLDADGRVPVPTKPGLGITVIPDAVEKFREELIVIR